MMLGKEGGRKWLGKEEEDKKREEGRKERKGKNGDCGGEEIQREVKGREGSEVKGWEKRKRKGKRRIDEGNG